MSENKKAERTQQPEAPRHVLAVEWFPDTRRLEFTIPANAVEAGGLLALLDAAIKMRVIGPCVTPSVVAVPPGALGGIKLN